jgi:glycosyltransferase involved in cell wall biosynthesis
LTILIPCLNECETLDTCIRKAGAWIARTKVEVEILIADNGSTCGSQDIARGLGARVVDVRERGYGAALYYGSQATPGEWSILGDSDAKFGRTFIHAVDSIQPDSVLRGDSNQQ